MSKIKKKKPSLYEDRIVIFIDILGFKELIKSTVDKKGKEVVTQTYHIKKLLDTVDECMHEHPEMVSSKVITQFSDSIVISFKYTDPSMVFYTLLDILHLNMQTLYLGELIRGAVCFGKLYHTTSRVFGPGLVKAYEFETQSAIFPRVIIEPNVIKLGAANSFSHTSKEEEAYLKNLAKQDGDGQFYVEYFENVLKELENPNEDWPSYLDLIRKITLKGVNSSNPSVRSKYLWLKTKFNALVKRYTSKKYIKSVYKHLDKEYADYYKNLKEIPD